MFKRHLQFGPELREVLRLGWPMVLTQLFIMMTGFIDTAMAGHYSSVDLAGLSLGSSILWPAFMLLTGLTMALTPITSQLNGEGKLADVGHQLRQGLWICVVTSTLLVTLLVYSDWVFALASVDPEAARIGTEYLRAVSWGVPPVVFYVALRHVCEGMGHTRPPMIISGAILPVNAFFNYALIYGKFGFPELGGVGAGYATAVVFWMELLMMLYVIRRPFYRASGLFERFEGIRLRTVANIAHIGLPIGLSAFLEMAVYSIIAFLIARIGVVEVAAHTIAGNLNWLSWVIPMSIGAAASIRVGYHVGARDLPTARSTGAETYKFALLYALFVSVVFVTLRYQLISVYSTDPAVIEIAAVLLLFIALYQIVDDTQVVCVGALRGYKDTRVPMLLGLIGFWVIGLPIGYALAEGWLLPGVAPGVYGYWTGLTLGLTTVAILAGLRLVKVSGDKEQILRLAGAQAA